MTRRMVDTVLIVGSMVRRRLDQMKRGTVDPPPVTKNVMMNSSKDSEKTRTVAPSSTGDT